MSNRIRIGIVGCGKVANNHVRGYREADGCEIVAVYDTSPEAAQRMAEATGAAVAESLAAMIAAHRVEAVSVCVPPAAHLAACRPFLEAGVAVLCEKPLEVNAERATELAALTERQGSVFQIGFNHRFHPPIIELKRLIDCGVLGRPILLRVLFGGYLALGGDHRTDPAASGGGCLIDHGCHAVDLFRHLVGEPDAVQAWTANAMQEVAIEDIGIVTLGCGRALGELIASYSLPVCGNWVEWYGTEGTAIVSYGNPGQPDLRYRCADAPDWIEPDCSAHSASRYTGEIRHFIACVRGEATAAVPAIEGLRSSRVSDAIYRSAAEGRRVPLAAASIEVPAPEGNPTCQIPATA